MRNRIALSFSILFLLSCQAENKAEQYLACYALEPSTKNEYLNKLTKKYIAKDLQRNISYVRLFQYEYEKLGFKQFLNKENLACDYIDEGVLYNNEQKAYIITCTPNQKYYMVFNYNSKSWKLAQSVAK
jgi:hypothetical protein